VPAISQQVGLAAEIALAAEPSCATRVTSLGETTTAEFDLVFMGRMS